MPQLPGSPKFSDEMLLTVKQVAARLQISETLVRRMIWRRQVGYIDMNRGGQQIVARFTEQHIQDFLAEREVGSPKHARGRMRRQRDSD